MVSEGGEARITRREAKEIASVETKSWGRGGVRPCPARAEERVRGRSGEEHMCREVP